jgi:hypothetical protein
VGLLPIIPSTAGRRFELERISDECSVLGAMPTLAWACFSENIAAWPRKRGHGTRYTKVRCALE